MQHGNAPLFFISMLCVLGITLQIPLPGVAHVVNDSDRVDSIATDAAIAAPIDTKQIVNTRKSCERTWGALVDDQVIASGESVAEVK
jgi:hypothetical protein